MVFLNDSWLSPWLGLRHNIQEIAVGSPFILAFLHFLLLTPIGASPANPGRSPSPLSLVRQWLDTSPEEETKLAKITD